MPKLSVCIIARNEESFIEGCLASVKDVADELIVVDTGSTDRTKTIARDQGAKISEHAWNDDFSESRNFALDMATGDWILQLDADERLYEGDAELLLSLIHNNDIDSYECQIINLVKPRTFEGAGIHKYPRLFRAQAFRYSGIIHESLVHTSAPKRATVRSDVHIIHLGYLSSKMKAKKGKRNTVLLKKALSDTPNDALLNFYLGREHSLRGELEEALLAFDQAESLGFGGNTGFFAMLIVERSFCLRKMGNFDEALERLESACQSFSDYPDIHSLAGDICFQQGNWESALIYYEKCAGLPMAASRYPMTKTGLKERARKMASDCRWHLENEAKQNT